MRTTGQEKEEERKGLRGTGRLIVGGLAGGLLGFFLGALLSPLAGIIGATLGAALGGGLAVWNSGALDTSRRS